MWGKEIIRMGSRWKIGDGESVFVGSDKWLPHTYSFTLSDPPFIPDDMRVVELKLLGGKWNKELIRAMFARDDAEAILGIPESESGIEDVMRWHYSKDGEYSVKSGYRVAMTVSSMACSSNPRAYADWWERL
jgi:hypothetical protein